MVKYIKLSNEEVQAIYVCISFAQDLRESLEFDDEKSYWDKYDLLTKNIGTALIAANKLAGYEI